MSPAGAPRAALTSSLTCLLTSALRHACANDTIHRDAFRHASRFSRTALQSSFSSAQAMLPCPATRAKRYIFGIARCAHILVYLARAGRWGWPGGRNERPGCCCTLSVLGVAARRGAKSGCILGAAGLCKACGLVLRAARSLAVRRHACCQSCPRGNSCRSSRWRRSRGPVRPAARRNARENPLAANRTPSTPEGAQLVSCRQCSRPVLS